jgi:hypothetical protein
MTVNQIFPNICTCMSLLTNSCNLVVLQNSTSSTGNLYQRAVFYNAVSRRTASVLYSTIIGCAGNNLLRYIQLEKVPTLIMSCKYIVCDRLTEAVLWYLTSSFKDSNLTTQRKYLPDPSRNTLKCWTWSANLNIKKYIFNNMHHTLDVSKLYLSQIIDKQRTPSVNVIWRIFQIQELLTYRSVALATKKQKRVLLT